MPSRADVSAERRAQIIQAALNCFARNGYHNTTMDNIVAESGLSKGSIYWYFESKRDLFAAAVMSFLQKMAEDALAAVDERATAADKLRALGTRFAQSSVEARAFLNLFAEFWMQSSRHEGLNRLWGDLLVEYSTPITAIIEEGIASGEFKAVDAQHLVLALMATYDGLLVYGTLIDDLDLGQVSHAFIETLLSGLVQESTQDV